MARVRLTPHARDSDQVRATAIEECLDGETITMPFANAPRVANQIVCLHVLRFISIEQGEPSNPTSNAPAGVQSNSLK